MWCHLGFSLRRSSIVPLVLNLDTHHIFAQYHVVLDDWFSSVSSSWDDPRTGDPTWDTLFLGRCYQNILDDNITTLSTHLSLHDKYKGC